MNRARGLLRRRKDNTAADDTDLVTSDSIDRSALSLTAVSTEGQHPFAATARRRMSRFAAQRPEGSVTHSHSTMEMKTADSITRSMTKKWFGVEESGLRGELPPSNSTGTRYVRSWLERQPPLPSTHSSDSEGRADQTLTHNRPPSESPGSQHVRFLTGVFCLCDGEGAECAGIEFASVEEYHVGVLGAVGD